MPRALVRQTVTVRVRPADVPTVRAFVASLYANPASAHVPRDMRETSPALAPVPATTHAQS